MENETSKVRVIVTVPNQKVVAIVHDPCDGKIKEHKYALCNLAANKKALKELSPNTYKLYMYLDLNQDGFVMALSYKDVHDVTGMSEKTYRKSVNELIEKGYLVHSKGIRYTFYDGELSKGSQVENGGRDIKDDLTEDAEKVNDLPKNRVGSQAKSNGEIIQDTTNYNTNNNTVDVANAPVAFAPSDTSYPLSEKKLQELYQMSMGSSSKSFDSPEEMIRIMDETIHDEYDKHGFCYNELYNRMKGTFYHCTNEDMIHIVLHHCFAKAKMEIN